MKLFIILSATFVFAMTSGLPAGAVLENRLDSLGPLKRYDPNGEAAQFLVKTHGNPRLGLPGQAGECLQRVTDRCWYLELKGHVVARMEPDYKTGEVALKDMLELTSEWSVSPDGSLVFGTRLARSFEAIGECFDLETGQSKWTFEKGQITLDVCFTPDGSQVVILHKPPNAPVLSKSAVPPTDFESLRKSTPPVSAAVSWYDAKSGELLRRVGLPGGVECAIGATSDYLAFSGDRLCVARPGVNPGGECFVIKPGATEPEKIEIGAVGSDERPRVQTGGVHGEFVVFYSNNSAVLYRQEDNGWKKLGEVELEGTPEGNSYYWFARFTPDGKHLVLSSCFKTIHVPTEGAEKRGEMQLSQGARLGDFSTDGKHFVVFHDGGGRVFDTLSWKLVESFDTRIHPPHCCPISEAGYSLSGNHIVSCDGARLLLWSKEGRQLAELFSPRSDTKEAVRMQSPVILEERGRIFAADGYDFLSWDLAALHKRLARKPDNIPRVKGEVVFRDWKQNDPFPEVMNISIDSKGANIVTATRSVVRYRPLATSAPIVVPVPRNDIFMNPRSLLPGANNSSMIVKAGWAAFNLDLTGKENAVLLSQGFIGADVRANRLFSIAPNRVTVSTHEFGKRDVAATLITLPTGWTLSPEKAVLSSDGRWIIANPEIRDRPGTLAVIDVAKRQVVHSQSMRWMITSLALSADGKRLLVGSSNRAIYEFDFLKMTAGE